MIRPRKINQWCESRRGTTGKRDHLEMVGDKRKEENMIRPYT